MLKIESCTVREFVFICNGSKFYRADNKIFIDLNANKNAKSSYLFSLISVVANKIWLIEKSSERVLWHNLGDCEIWTRAAAVGIHEHRFS